MRIISGKFGSRKISFVPSENTRETQDKIRGAVFNSLGNKVVDSIVLDLFAGSGAYALEALSRGAKFAYINDVSPIAFNTIKNNVASLKVEDSTKLYKMDYIKLLDLLNESKIKFDIIFLDPPYNNGLYKDAIKKMIYLLKLNSCLVVEHDKKNILDLDQSWGLRIYKESLYGNKKVTYLRLIDLDTEKESD